MPNEMNELAATPQTKPRLGATRARVGLAMRIERLWPLVAPLVWVAMAFFVLSWFGVFRASPGWLRIVLLIGLGLAALSALPRLMRYRDPRPHEIDRRLEEANALRHQPVSAQADTLPDNADPFARALWEEHRRRMARGLDRLGGTAPRADMPRRDPWALRTLAPLALLVAFGFSFGSLGGRIGDAFQAPALPERVASRLDAWVTPPDYTGVPPIFLTRDGVTNEVSDGAREVPAGSVLTLRIAEGDGSERVELIERGGEGRALEPSGDAVSGTAVAYEATLEEDATVRVTAGGGAREFAFLVRPDLEPTIAWRENEDGEAHETTRTGALMLHYEVSDDYAPASGRALLTPVTGEGARPLYDVPEMALSMPRLSAENGERASGAARATRDLTEHPAAGALVEVVLEVTDRAGQTARSAPRRLLLPEREFRNPLALALLEQRRALALDANEQENVVANLDLVLLHAETTVDDTVQFLGLSTARDRVAHAWSDDLLRESVDYLWEVARGIEDGATSTAERRLRDAQDALEQALEDGASDEELQALMEKLREALEEFMTALAEQMQANPQQAMPIMPNMEMMTEDDLQRMMDNMEEMARSGQREQAQAMLDELRRMTEQMQAGQPPTQQQSEQAAEMQRQMQEMADLLREQQELMDETFRMENSRPPNLSDPTDPQTPQQSQPPGMQPPGMQPPGQQGEQQQGQQQGQQPQQGQTPQAGEPMTPEEFANAMEALRQRQEALQERLDAMQEAMEGMGLQPSEEFGEAGEAMGDAEGNLGEGQSGPAVGDQGRAIEALRQGSQNMMQQMMQAMQGQGPGMMPGAMPGQQPGQGQQGQGPGRFTQGFGNPRSDRDPLGRPRATTGPQFGDEIEVPDEIDTQRAREILEAIRERLGRQLTPRMEREYLERLLELR